MGRFTSVFFFCRSSPRRGADSRDNTLNDARRNHRFVCWAWRFLSESTEVRPASIVSISRPCGVVVSVHASPFFVQHPTLNTAMEALGYVYGLV
jgi:hypothetical protein